MLLCIAIVAVVIRHAVAINVIVVARRIITLLSSKPLSVLMFVALAVVLVDVRHSVAFVVHAVARCAVAIIADNDKTPALR